MPNFVFGLVGLALIAWIAAGCGEDGKPSPGFADPCETPMGGAIGCPPATGGLPLVATVEQACQRLVSCGILAGEYLRSSSTSCSKSADCAGGQCLKNANGDDRCHYPYLDYRWCVGGLNPQEASLCGQTQSYSGGQVEATLQCIMTTPCTSLGLLFWQKRISSSDRPELDKITCPDGKTDYWTATVCDHGLLSY